MSKPLYTSRPKKEKTNLFHPFVLFVPFRSFFCEKKKKAFPPPPSPPPPFRSDTLKIREEEGEERFMLWGRGKGESGKLLSTLCLLNRAYVEK